jgi:hypothetical protein
VRWPARVTRVASRIELIHFPRLSPGCQSSRSSSSSRRVVVRLVAVREQPLLTSLARLCRKSAGRTCACSRASGPRFSSAGSFRDSVGSRSSPRPLRSDAGESCTSASWPEGRPKAGGPGRGVARAGGLIRTAGLMSSERVPSGRRAKQSIAQEPLHESSG